MTSADFVVRPFLGTDLVQSVLDEFSLDVASLRVTAGSTLTLAPAEFVRAEVELIPPTRSDLATVLSQGAAQAEVGVEDLEFLVAAVSRRLKVVDLVVRLPLKELDPSDRSFRLATAGRRPTALRTPYGGCSIEVYVVLARQLDRAPLRPWRKGTWLGRTSFEVRTSLGTAGFAPIPLTAKLRDDLGLPPGAVRYVAVEDPLQPGDLDHGIRLYVDESLLDALAAAPNTAAARTMQRQLFLDLMSAVVYRASAMLGSGVMPALDEIAGTLLGVLLERSVSDLDPADRRGAMDRALALVVQEPARFVSEIEGWVDGIGADMVKAIGGDR